ncbi:2-dehydro-3-deoxygalactonokinase [Rhizobium alvei]|uniref:2-dehydro-3-deoxygalactonokinase n=1 Tax=Rhizobium alvei TaxID=1132659 RepID=A0ABT8YG22_9HYPH|nr:2-dehydro-3-deoxygalactonokinase [Rhizobium alvei]MDO6962625.1 2-dehydro-3-deoxygalactonokinase [Rhizobium alvei]
MSEFRFAAVDWGTSSFRLWLMTADGRVLGERRSHEGMTSARESGFAAVLDSHLAALEVASDLPVLICGMAGARQGWQEAGYIEVPAALDAIGQAAIRIEKTERDIRILPGLCQRQPWFDVMRGEETQLLGAIAGGLPDECLVVMPGTHSKWVHIQAGRVQTFSTFMTGELFAAISGHTILSHTVNGSSGAKATMPCFADAVRRSVASPARLTQALFAIRAQGLLASVSPEEAEATLSGLLIGEEIAGGLGMAPHGLPVALVASGRHAELYQAALTAAGLSPHIVDADAVVQTGLLSAARTIWHKN